MQPERWQRIQEIFDGALDLPAERRQAFVRDACAGDRELCEQVVSLLARHENDPSYLETPAAALVTWPLRESGAAEDDPDAATPDPLLGTRAGPYRIERRLGIGGMGTVYLGSRDDDQYLQDVAVKVLRLGLDSASLHQRFRQERQILAALDHPAVTRLLDGGVLPDGRPYLVMEKVDGEPIDRHCRRLGLSVRRRLLLFREVCEAVSYAHRNLVVHRDLKPNNVLVQADEQVKLLDFGIAKLLSGEPSPHAAPPTLDDVRLLTPEYASPEQLRGEPVTTAADVFALGVLLYELLTDAHPFCREGQARHELAVAITTEDPVRPSARAPHLRRQLRGDLDTIVLKALHKDPERRYRSVEALNEDLRRHLSGHPVQVRGDGLGYRLGKFARRNWPAITTAGAVFALLLVFVAVLGGQNRRIARQTVTIADERDRAEQTTSLLTGMFDVSDPYNEQVRADTLRVRDFLRQRQDRLLEEAGDRPELEAEATLLLSDLYSKLGLYDEAQPLAERALELWRRLSAEPRPEEAACLDRLGTIAQASDDLDAAIDHFTLALALRRRLFAPPHPLIAESLNNLGLALENAGRLDEAEAMHGESLTMRRRLFGARSTDVAQSLNALAVLNFRQGDLQTSKRRYREALAIRRELLGEVHPYVANLLNNLARCVQEQGQLAEADTLLRRAIAVWEQTLGPEHPTVSAGYYNLGRLAAQRGDRETAVALLQRANDQDRKNYPPDHLYVADSSHALGKALLADGRPGQAETLLREAAAVFAARRGALDPDATEATGQLGECLTRLGRHAEAETTLTACLVRLTAAGEDTSAAAGDLRLCLAELYRAWGRPELAEAYRESP